ncbi:MAG TPA: hypothetical protein VGJ79_03415 [Candidatus Dormibacteraeota bacterium]|jgi:hypothetical protein
MSVETRDGFDQLIEQELRSHAAKQSGQSPLPTQARYHAWNRQNGLRLSVFAKAATVVLSTKAAVALIVVAAAVGVTGAEEAAITGSINPADWGKQLAKQVQSCATELASGSSSAGTCASSFSRPAANQAPTDHDLTGNGKADPTANQGGGQDESGPGNGPPATHPGNGPPATHSGNGSPTSNPHKPSPTPGGKKPKTHIVGGPFGSAGPPTSHRPPKPQ